MRCVFDANAIISAMLSGTPRSTTMDSEACEEDAVTSVDGLERRAMILCHGESDTMQSLPERIMGLGRA